jgi:hypothetical protein
VRAHNPGASSVTNLRHAAPRVIYINIYIYIYIYIYKHVYI